MYYFFPVFVEGSIDLEEDANEKEHVEHKSGMTTLPKCVLIKSNIFPN